jgi:hypothetical protein
MKRNRPELYQSAMRLFVRRPADHEYSEQIAGMTYQSQVWDTRRGSVGRRLCRSKGNVVMVRLSYAARAAVTPCIPFWAGKHGMTGRIAFESVYLARPILKPLERCDGLTVHVGAVIS